MCDVTIFEHYGYAGKSQTLTPGKYNMGSLKIGNDRLSSLKVPRGWKVSLYQHANFTGHVKVVTQDNPAITDFNDQTSSIIVTAPKNDKTVSIFEHYGYAGKSQELTPGRYNMGSLSIGNDRLSSLKVPEGLRATLYQHGNFQGATRTYTKDNPAIADFNDQTSSIVVEEANADPLRTSLNQFAWIPGTNDYKFGFNSIPNMVLRGFPKDADYSRWAMLHDGTDYRVYLFRKGSNDTFYQGAFNRSTNTYDFGFRSIPRFTLKGMPADADASNFAMLHDGVTYRLYLKSKNKPNELIQFGYNPSIRTYEFGFRSIPRISLSNVPSDIDWNGWGMLHDGHYFRLYNWKNGGSQFYQAAFNGREYQFGYASIPILDLTGTPSNSNVTDFAMLHDGSAYRFYLQTL